MGSETTAFGHLLRRYRRAAELTQEGLAERAGISGRAVRAMEAGEPHRPRPDTLALLLEALAIPEAEQEAFLATAARLGPAALSASPPLATRLLTVLLADLRGYTRFTQEQGDEAAARLASRFADLVEAEVTAQDGQLLELRGDEALAVFTSARQALCAAVELQVHCDHQMGGAALSFPLRVGIGLDAGEVVPAKGGYRGGALNLAARLCDLAGRGTDGRSEVLCSETVTALAGRVEGLAYVNRGDVRLKGRADAIRVIQVGREGELPADRPPLQPRAVTRPSNLPVQPTSFVGRTQEVDEVTGLLLRGDVRLLTLTGPGGAGKTRLAVEVAGRLAERFSDGIVFVSLASLADPALVASTIAGTLDLGEAGSAPILDILTQYLESKRLLLVLDNFEHLLDAAIAISQLLAACPLLTILVTSRAVLHLAAEQEYPVPPLPVPALEHLSELAALSGYDAIRLFVHRAQAARPTFQLTEENAAAIVEICQRLDGLPLALELAAARIRLFPPHALLARLSSRLGILTGGAQDVPARQQTLRNTIDWSYRLLPEDEQTLFARLSVFSGGCTLEAAEAVCTKAGEMDLLAVLTALVEQNLVQQVGAQAPRFHMLETIREYGTEKLREQGGEAQTKDAHVAYYMKAAQAAEPEQWGSRQRDWLERLDADVDNLRAALTWLLSQGKGAEVLRLALDLHRLWMVRGYWHEGRRWLEEGLRLGDSVPTSLRARALDNTAAFLFALGDFDLARPPLEQAHGLFRALDDKAWQATTSRKLGDIAANRGDYEQAVALYKESLALAQEVGHVRRSAHALASLGGIAREQRDFVEAKVRYEEALALYRAAGDTYLVASALADVGLVVLEQGNLEEARDRFEQSLLFARELGAKSAMAVPLLGLGSVARRQGRLEEAAERFREGLILSRELGDKNVILMILTESAALAAVAGEADRAAHLGGAEAAARALREGRPPLSWRGGYLRSHQWDRRERVLHAAQAKLGEDAWTRAWEAGRSMSLEEAVACALREG